jgi:hypothetical protein
VDTSQPATRPEARSRTDARSCETGNGLAMSVTPHAESTRRPGETIAGLLAALSIFASCIGLAYRPARLIPAAILLALLATALGGRHSRLATIAIVIGGVCFIVGMAIAVLTDNPIY